MGREGIEIPLSPLPLSPGVKALRVSPGEGHSQKQAKLTILHRSSPIDPHLGSCYPNLQPPGWGGGCCVLQSLGGKD